MRLWITGYRSFELGIFNQKDLKLKIIKYALKKEILRYLDEGLEWVLVGGQLGIEQWAFEVVKELQVDYPELKVALMLPDKSFGSNWKENNQEVLATLKKTADFVDTVFNVEKVNLMQLNMYKKFMLDHTDAALIFYDEEFEGKAKYDLKAIENYRETFDNYAVNQVVMDELEEYLHEYQEYYLEESADDLSELSDDYTQEGVDD